MACARDTATRSETVTAPSAPPAMRNWSRVAIERKGLTCFSPRVTSHTDCSAGSASSVDHVSTIASLSTAATATDSLSQQASRTDAPCAVSNAMVERVTAPPGTARIKAMPDDCPTAPPSASESPPTSASDDPPPAGDSATHDTPLWAGSIGGARKAG